MESGHDLEFSTRESPLDQLRRSDAYVPIVSDFERSTNESVANKRKADGTTPDVTCFYATDMPLATLESPHKFIERTLEFTTHGTDEITLYENVYSSLLSLEIERIKTSGHTIVGSRTVTAVQFSNRLETLPKCANLTTEYHLDQGEFEHLTLLEQGKQREVLFALRCNLNEETLAEGTIKRDDGWTLVPANHLIIDRLKRRYPTDTFARQVYYAFSPDMFNLVLKDEELQEGALCTDGCYSDSCHMTVVADGETQMRVRVRFIAYEKGAHPRICY